MNSRRPSGPAGPLPPVAKLVGGVVILIVAAALGIPLTTGGNHLSPAPPTQPPSGRAVDPGAAVASDRRHEPGPATSPATTGVSPPRPSTSASSLVDGDPDLDDLLALIGARASGEMVTTRAVVHRLLDDDHDGDRHQRFLISIDPGSRRPRTVKVSHNIDLAPRVPVEEGDLVTIRGQFEWNDLGGVLHWTHHDPGDRREGGWIELDGRRYE